MLARLLFPPKCLLCRDLLARAETDLCHHCRIHTQEFTQRKRRIPFIAQWTALWYYKGDVRKSIHRFKFGNARGYADSYGRHLALRLQDTGICQQVDLVTWVPISTLRRMKRGYDQSALLAKATAKELGLNVMPLLKKFRHTSPQSGIRDAAQRRANVLGVYKVPHRDLVAGKRILLLDDVLTTGATASECAKTLLTAGAKEVYFAVIAAASHDKK